MSLAEELYKHLVFQDPAWDFKTLNPERDFSRAEKAIASTLDAIDPNLRHFADRGGKLLIYHGWSDPGIAPLNSVHYYENVVQTFGGAAKTRESIRLFMLPGVNHCRGGAGPDTFDGIGALSNWVENGRAPDSIEASHLTNGKVDRTRPLCPYPQVAAYKGGGSTDEAANFGCK
jgi:feruloyl esterase